MCDAIQPRILRRDEAARHLGYIKATSTSDSYIHNKLGIKPHPNRPGRYDRFALDLAIDKHSGITSGKPLTEVEKWFHDKHEKEREAQEWLDSL